MKTARCPSCTEKIDRRRDRLLLPYCNIVCRTLGNAGLGWRLCPYRIVDFKSGTVLTTGPVFDLTANGIEALQKKAEHVRQPAFQPPRVTPLEPLVPHALEQLPQLESTFSEVLAA